MKRRLRVTIEDPPRDGRYNSGVRIDWDALRADIRAAGGRWVKLEERHHQSWVAVLREKIGEGFEVTSRGEMANDGPEKRKTRQAYFYARSVTEP